MDCDQKLYKLGFSPQYLKKSIKKQDKQQQKVDHEKH